MSKFRNISSILRGRWLIDRQWAENHLPVVMRLLDGDDLGIFDVSKGLSNQHIVAIDSEDGEENYFNEKLSRFPLAGNMSGAMFKASRWNSFNDAPENSVAIIPVSGPIMKSGGDCGEPGAVHFANWIKSANESPKISGILLHIDSPGGMVDGTQTVVDAIKKSKKPVIAFIDDGMMASAATWIGTSAHEVYASQKTDTIGSIGVYCTIYDYRDRLKQLGYVEHNIYAPQSTDKNKGYLDALEGNYKIIQDELKFIADEFIKAVKENRKGKLDAANNEPFTGKMFRADEAIALGLIDGYATIETAVARIYELTKKEETFIA